jgi:HPt (histidine-containing phosphotransfer) domain-containing protein
MEQKVLDLTFLYDLSGDDPQYIYDVITLFLEVVPEGIDKLEKVINETDDYEAIHKQAHFLKSSASIIKIKDIYEHLARIVSLAREHTGKMEISEKMARIRANFDEALPLIAEEQKKCKPVINDQ